MSNRRIYKVYDDAEEHQKREIELYNLYTAYVRNEKEYSAVTDQILEWHRTGWLDEAVIIGVDRLLDQIDAKAPDYAFKYRLLNLEAAKILGDPVAHANTAFSASRVALNIKDDPLQALDFSIEAAECNIAVHNNPALPPHFRNISRLFCHKAWINPTQFEQALGQLLDILTKTIQDGWERAIITDCATSIANCLQTLVSLIPRTPLVGRVRQLITEQLIPSLPKEIQPAILQRFRNLKLFNL
jgi:hypothetical protein